MTGQSSWIRASLLAGALVSCAVDGPVIGQATTRLEEVHVPDPADIRATSVVEGLDVPWSLAFLGDGRALVTERPGRIRLIRNGRMESAPYLTLPVQPGGPTDLSDAMFVRVLGGEGGLMGLAVDPGFPNRPYVYVMQTYRTRDGEDANRVLRLRDEGDRGVVDRVVIAGIPASSFHDGGRIAFGPDGMLYVTTGDASRPELAQDPGSLAGKILRVTPEGAVPDDNPFPGSPVWSLGHRNPQGLAWHPGTGDLFASEHGPSGEFGLGGHDEINVIRRGGNYGWPRVVGAAATPPFIDPVTVWGDASYPPGGIAFRNGRLFVATLKSETLLAIELSPGPEGYRVGRVAHLFAERRGEGRFGRLRDAVVGLDGALYVLTSNRDGRGNPRPGDDRINRLDWAD